MVPDNPHYIWLIYDKLDMIYEGLGEDFLISLFFILALLIGNNFTKRIDDMFYYHDSYENEEDNN